MLLVFNCSIETRCIWSHLKNKPFIFQTSFVLPIVKLLNTNTLQMDLSFMTFQVWCLCQCYFCFMHLYVNCALWNKAEVGELSFPLLSSLFPFFASMLKNLRAWWCKHNYRFARRPAMTTTSQFHLINILSSIC